LSWLLHVLENELQLYYLLINLKIQGYIIKILEKWKLSGPKKKRKYNYGPSGHFDPQGKVLLQDAWSG